MGDIRIDNPEYFMYLAAGRIIQSWLSEADDEEVAAASLTMDKNLLDVINRNLTQEGKGSIKKSILQVNDENRQSLTESFYQKLLKVLIIASAFSVDSLEF